ncbi:carbohydrate-binding domain-containing protein [Azospirillum himalayense]|uniref:Carbohydrate-binding domain-containing protein n=1 Tax=Azospirillum himalayense TaxID=654847 RepID=A0ABW0FXS0_9PROT
MANLYGPKTLTAPAGAIVIAPGANIQSIVNGAPAGATFWLQPGEYRLQSITPKDNQTFIGAEGAVLNGSKLLTGFSQDSAGRWVIGGQTQQGERRATDEATPGAMRAGYPETVYVDDKPLTPVDALSKLKAGTFYFDYNADKIYLGDNPAGHKVEAGTTARAFGGTADGVTVKNLVIEKYTPPAQEGAIQGDVNWTIQDNELRLNYAVGATAQDGSKFIGNYVHDNGEMGLGGAGAKILVEGNEIARNGAWSGIDVFWEGGGTKFAYTTDLVVRGNYSHDNTGFGLWTDIDNVGTLYENNVLVNNSGGGITHEISYDAIIRNNVMVGNGAKPQAEGWLWGGSIQIQNSQNVEAYGNKIDITGVKGANSIVMIQQDRGAGEFGTWTTTNNKIHDNIIVSKDGNGQSGGVADHNEAGMLNGGNVWDNNTYYMPDGDRWRWGDFPDGDSWSAYMNATTQDEHSTLSQAYPATAGWTTATPTAPPAPTPTDTTPTDTTPPTVKVSIADSNVTKGEAPLVTFAFSEAVKGFALADTTVKGGTLSGFKTVDASTYTAVFTPSTNTKITDANVAVKVGSYTDLAGNAGKAGTSVGFAVDTTTTTPTVPTTPTASVTTIKVNASGAAAGGVNAHFKVLVDGKAIGDATVGTAAKDYSFTTTLTAGQPHKVQIQYDNDGFVNGQDRNLFVNKVTINGTAHNPTDSIVSYDKGALDGKDVVKGQSSMWWGGTLVVDAPAKEFPAGGSLPQSGPSTTTITVNASGAAAGGVNAHFNLLVDGQKVGEGVAGTSAKDYSFTTSLSADQAHKVQIQYDNDAVVNGQDRSLIVNKVTINGKSVLPTDGVVTYDKGALDGKDVVKGQSGLWWNGTLVVDADKSFFPSATPVGEATALALDAGTDSVWSHVAAQQAAAAPAAVADAVAAANSLYAAMPVDAGYDPLFDHIDPSLLSHAA